MSFYIIFCVSNLLIVGINGQAPESHKWPNRRQSTLDDNRTLKLCQMTNYTNILSLVNPLLRPRVVGTKEHRAAGKYLQKKMKENNFYTEWDVFTADTPYGSKRFGNLVATFDPSASKRLILACHYDSKIFTYNFIGATDSALPCALLLDLAETLGPLLKKRGKQAVTLQLVFFDGEEAFVRWTDRDSLYGSRHLANKWKTSHRLDDITALILLDLLGAENPTIFHFEGYKTDELFGHLPRIEKTLARLQCLNEIPDIFYNNIKRMQHIPDDHMPFYNKGVPVLHLIPTPFPSEWHTPRDDRSAMDERTIENLSSILRCFVAEYLTL